MREIKFRGWSKEYNQMFTHQMMETSMKEILIFVEKHKGIKAPGGIFLPTLDPDLNLMQFTGLKDKNGKEIYEGDIVQFAVNSFGSRGIEKNIDKGVVYYNEDMTISIDGWMLCRIKSKEVIGNIFENPELLEVH